MSTTPLPPYPPVQPPARKGIRPLWIALAGGVLATLLMCGIGVVSAAVAAGNERKANAAATAPAKAKATPSATPTLGYTPTPNLTADASGPVEAYEPPSPFNLKPGKWAEVSSFGSSAEVRVSKATWESGSYCGMFQSGTRTLTIHVSYRQLTGEGMVSEYSFQYVDPQGVVHNPAIACIRPELSADYNVRAGQYRQGYVAFVVDGRKGGTVEYDGGLSSAASWKMPK